MDTSGLKGVYIVFTVLSFLGMLIAVIGYRCNAMASKFMNKPFSFLGTS
jgi:Na+-transporting methylmalonyl-CoA/oxaloacetate decarboxylase gamma subunit